MNKSSVFLIVSIIAGIAYCTWSGWYLDGSALSGFLGGVLGITFGIGVIFALFIWATRRES